MFKFSHFYCLIVFFAFSCGVSSKGDKSELEYEQLSYAKGFKVAHGDGFSVVEVLNPWDTSKMLSRYVLVDRNNPEPDNLPEGMVVKVPVERIAATTTVDCALFEDFGLGDNIVGVTDAEYIAVESVKKGLKSGDVSDLGATVMPNAEKLVMSGAEVMVVSPAQNQNYGWAAKINVPIIDCAAYMEQTPLGQAEWVKFHALFYGKEQMADSIFKNTEKEYLKIRDLASNASEKPRVLAEKCYGQTWWLAAGGSYAAQLYKDAGADYMWANSEGAGSLALSFETVFDVASGADLWLIRYHNPVEDMTYDMLAAENNLYREFDAFKNKNVFGCNTARNNYYEKATYYPNLVLADLVGVLHPEIGINVESNYYKKLEE